MKKFKKLIPALCMLLVSAVMLGSTTFAWFSMNTTVTASNMQVQAKADQVYLQIKEKSESFTTNGNHTSIASTVAKKSILPTNVYKSFDENNPVAFAGGKEFVWVSNYSVEADKSDKAGLYTNVTTQIDSYALKFEYTIRLRPDTGASAAPGKLKVTAVEFEDASTTSGLKGAVSVLVVCGDYSAVYKQTTTGTFTKSAGDAALSAAAFASTDGTYVAVYVFFDGDNTNCKTTNIVLNDVFSVKITFNCNADE